MSVALNCSSHSLEDVEVISNIIKMRLKTKQLAAHYITCVRFVQTSLSNVGMVGSVGFRSVEARAAAFNRNIGYPRFRTHGSVSVRLFQISVQVCVFFFYKRC